MDWASFIVGVLSAVAWLSVVLMIVLLFRRELRPLIQSLRKFSWGNKILEFDKGLEVAEDTAKELQSARVINLLAAPQEDERFESTLEISPELAVVEAWLPIERELHALAAKRGYTAGRARSLTYIMHRLTTDGVIDPATEKLINELRDLRNLAVHRSPGPALSVEDARRYGELAETVAGILRRETEQ
jgi:hypothetical protein